MVFGFDWVTAVSQYGSWAEFAKEGKDLYGYTSSQLNVVKESVHQKGGGVCVNLDYSMRKSVLWEFGPHWAKRSPMVLGRNIAFINLYGLTAEEEMAIMAHEFGHAAAGHTGGYNLDHELEADRFAAMTVGPDHMHNALYKIMSGMHDYFGSRIEYDEDLMVRLRCLVCLDA